MSKFTIERYFTSIGRSFYVSEEFNDLKKDKKIEYNAISNFGIGFLSSFMVSKEVLVKTKNVFDSDALEIEIPNYEGCFFVRESNKRQFGTEITLYEDNRELFDFTGFEKYIRKVFLGTPLKINIKIGNANKFVIDSYQLQKNMLKAIQEEGELIFYIPFSEKDKKASFLSWKELISSNIEALSKFGISFNLNKMYDNRYHRRIYQKITNQGLLISTEFMPFEIKDEWYENGVIQTNYPSSFIQLDVARETISNLRGKDIKLNNVPYLLNQQVLSFLQTPSKNLYSSNIIQINRIDNYLKYRIGAYYINTIHKETFTLQITETIEGIELSIIRIKDIPVLSDNEKHHYFTGGHLLKEGSSFLENTFVIEKIFGVSSEKLKDERSRTSFIKEISRKLKEKYNRKEKKVEMEQKIEQRRKREMRREMEREREMEQRRKREMRREMEMEREMGRRRRSEYIERSEIPTLFPNESLHNIFIWEFVYYFSNHRDSVKHALLFSISVLKTEIFSKTLVSDYEKFKYVINFKAFQNFLESDKNNTLFK